MAMVRHTCMHAHTCPCKRPYRARGWHSLAPGFMPLLPGMTSSSKELPSCANKPLPLAASKPHTHCSLPVRSYTHCSSDVNELAVSFSLASPHWCQIVFPRFQLMAASRRSDAAHLTSSKTSSALPSAGADVIEMIVTC